MHFLLSTYILVYIKKKKNEHILVLPVGLLCIGYYCFRSWKKEEEKTKKTTYLLESSWIDVLFRMTIWKTKFRIHSASAERAHSLLNFLHFKVLFVVHLKSWEGKYSLAHWSEFDIGVHFYQNQWFEAILWHHTNMITQMYKNYFCFLGLKRHMP